MDLVDGLRGLVIDEEDDGFVIGDFRGRGSSRRGVSGDGADPWRSLFKVPLNEGSGFGVSKSWGRSCGGSCGRSCGGSWGRSCRDMLKRC